MECLASNLDNMSLLDGKRHNGVAVIIGNSYTRADALSPDRRKLHPLRGPLRDADMMKKALDYLGFLTIVKLNLSEEELMSFLYPLANDASLKSCKRFVFTFSGHGGDGFICSEDEKKIEVHHIVEALTPKDSSDPLVGIPRLFFFDTCRGDKFDPGFIARGGDEKWKHKIPSTGDMLVAFATSPGYKAFEEDKGGVWTNILAKKLVISDKSILDILTEVNEELIKKLQSAQMGSFQQPELIGRLNSIVCLLKESGKPPMYSLPTQNPGSASTEKLPSPFSSRPGINNEFFKSPKSLLNEFCQSMKFSVPTYSSNSDSGSTVTTVSIVIEGNMVKHSHQSNEVVSTKKLRKECEECVAEKAYLALTELYGVSHSRPELQKSQSCQQPDSHNSLSSASRPELQKAPSCLGIGETTKKAKSQLNELFQKHNASSVKYDSHDDGSDDNHNFKSTLSYSLNGRRYQYTSQGGFGRKQEAEEDAAQLALHHFEQQSRQPVSRGSPGHHYKSMLKEKYCDVRQLSSPEYNTQPANGGFVSVVNLPQYGPVTGPVGGSMKEAEQLAAQEALRKLRL